MIWRWAFRDLVRRPGRSALSLLGIAIATALLLDMVLLSGGIERSFGQLLARSGYQLRVTPRGTLPFDSDAQIDSAATLAAAFSQQHDVAQVGALLGTVGSVRHGGQTISLVVYGVTPESQGIYRLVRGADLVAADSNGVLLGEPSAARVGRTIGDTIELVGRPDPRVGSAAERRRLVIRGIANFIYDARDQPSVAVVLPVAQSLAGPSAHDHVSMLLVRVADGADAEQVAKVLRATFPAVGVSSIAEMVDQFRLRLTYFRQLSLILGSIALAVTVMLVGTILAISVNERLGDIAALRALGIARSTIVRQVIVQGMLLTVVGGTLGIAFGLGTARWLDAILTSFPGLPAAISFFVVNPSALLVAAATLLLTGMIGSALPAWRAAHTPIATTLRNEAA